MRIAYDLLLNVNEDECPMPTIKTKGALDGLRAGEVLKVVIGKEEAAKNLHTFVKASLCELIYESKQDEDGHAFYIRKL
jgi:TusA-related sulfurtransferase